MDIYIATQPIFDDRQQVFAYEVLYRTGFIDKYDTEDGDMASSNVIVHTFSTIGLKKLTSNKPAFINFTENLIDQEVATLFPSNKLIVEVLETVNCNDSVIRKLKELKKRGYMIALDDYVYKKENARFLNLADIVKVDYLNTNYNDKVKIISKLKNRNKILLAEKIESYEDFEEAKRLGFTLFQGFFFSRPNVLAAKDISPLKANYLQLIQKVNQDVIDFKEISVIISRDLSLSYKLLKLVNSVAFGFRERIKSIKHALVIIGENELKKWVSLIALRGISDDKPDEIMRMTLIRARFVELLSHKINLRNRSSDIFMMGLFSMIDVCMNRPIRELLDEVPINNDIKEALIFETGVFREPYRLVMAYEKGHWDEVRDITRKLYIDEEILLDIYFNSIEWYDSITTSNIERM